MTDTNEATCLLETSEATSRDQREWTRFKPEQTNSFLLFEDEQIAVEVIDESFDGVGVLVHRDFDAKVDDPVEIIYYGLPVRGVIRSVAPQGQRIRIGIQWTCRRRRELDGRRPRCRTESDFFLFAGLPVACRIVDQAGNKLIALLPDRTEVELSSDDVCAISRFQRLADLEGADEEIRLLTAVYRLGTPESSAEALRAILNLEFAHKWD